MDWKKYLEEELKYYDEHPDEDHDPIEWLSTSLVVFRYIRPISGESSV